MAIQVTLEPAEVYDLIEIVSSKRVELQFAYADMSDAYTNSEDSTAKVILDALYEQEKRLERLGNILNKLSKI